MTYCKLCKSCGEDGCCSYNKCFEQLLNNNNCSYGAEYLKDIQLYQKISELSFDIVSKVKLGELDKDNVQEYFDKKYNEYYDQIFSI